MKFFVPPLDYKFRRIQRDRAPATRSDRQSLSRHAIFDHVTVYFPLQRLN